MKRRRLDELVEAVEEGYIIEDNPYEDEEKEEGDTDE